MEIKYYNCPDPNDISTVTLPERSEFLDYMPNFDLIAELAGKYADKKYLVVIGHGGSVSSFAGMYNSMRERSSKVVYFISTVDPDYISEVKQSAPVGDTLVIAISKSGETVTQIEALLQFNDYETLFITREQGPLFEMAKRTGSRSVVHPEIGGRYSDLTEVALVPAAICGLDVKAMYESAKTWYSVYGIDNHAFQAASIMHKLETDSGIVDVFMPFYDSHLFYTSSLIVQLCHESFGKDGKGQTYFAHTAPESQHHTNQRFLGGRKNIAGWFMSVQQPLVDIITSVPEDLQNIALKTSFLKSLDGIPLSSAMKYEREAVIETAHQAGIPMVDQTISERNASELGHLLGFWQLYAVYASVLRGVDPFDQPQVEANKKLSFEKRLKHS